MTIEDIVNKYDDGIGTQTTPRYNTTEWNNLEDAW